MLELSMSLPIRVQNGGLFISRGVCSHPARKLQSWEIIFVEKGTLTICEEDEIFNVNAGESLLLWPERSHVGVGEFPADLKFYWLHFEVLTRVSGLCRQRCLTFRNIPASAIHNTLFRCFASFFVNRRTFTAAWRWSSCYC